MDELSALVSAILRSPRIRNKLVVLCEGDLLPVGVGGPWSPQMYGRLERMPDANFYKACVPQDWQSYRLPQFFNCGGRSRVLQVYRALLDAHREDPEDSYLTPEKLYALVDLDLQTDSMPEGYPWRTTEDVHADLYHDGAIKKEPDARHRIWVTALIHKEAFFVLPAAVATWADGASPFLDGAPLDLRTLHTLVARRLRADADVAAHLDIVKARLGRFDAGASLSCGDGEALCASWLAAAGGAHEEAAYEGLVKALLSVAKVKPIWSEITPDPRWGTTVPVETFREQLALRIARDIARLTVAAHPLAGFFAWLKPRR